MNPNAVSQKGINSCKDLALSSLIMIAAVAFFMVAIFLLILMAMIQGGVIFY